MLCAEHSLQRPSAAAAECHQQPQSSHLGQQRRRAAAPPQHRSGQTCGPPAAAKWQGVRNSAHTHLPTYPPGQQGSPARSHISHLCLRPPPSTRRARKRKQHYIKLALACRAVQPWPSFISRLAPLDTSSSRAGSCPSRAATCSGATPAGRQTDMHPVRWFIQGSLLLPLSATSQARVPSNRPAAGGCLSAWGVGEGAHLSAHQKPCRPAGLAAASAAPAGRAGRGASDRHGSCKSKFCAIRRGCQAAAAPQHHIHAPSHSPAPRARRLPPPSRTAAAPPSAAQTACPKWPARYHVERGRECPASTSGRQQQEFRGQCIQAALPDTPAR